MKKHPDWSSAEVSFCTSITTKHFERLVGKQLDEAIVLDSVTHEPVENKFKATNQITASVRLRWPMAGELIKRSLCNPLIIAIDN